MSGKWSRTFMPGLFVGGAVITSKADAVSTTAFSFSMLCSAENCDPGLVLLKTAQKPLFSVSLLVSLKFITPHSAWANFMQH
jgi:hypothetical protein